MTHRFASLLCLSLLWMASPALAQLSMPGPFSDHMVLQRDGALPIWGHAAAGEMVEIALGDQRGSARADQAGLWRIDLEAMPAGGPHLLSVSSASDKIEFEDVLIGDVWICAGQSNMEWSVGASEGAELALKSSASRGRIRFLQQPHLGFDRPLDRMPNAWTLISPESVLGCSAVAYYFGERLQDELNVPIGLVEVNWGGTRVEPWMLADSYSAMQDVQASNEHYQQLIETPGTKQGRELYLEAMENWNRSPSEAAAKVSSYEDSGFAKGWAGSEVDLSKWESIQLPASFESIDPSLDGVLWFRRSVEIPANWAGKPLRLDLGTLDDHDVCYFDGHEIGRTQQWNLPRVYTVPAELVRAGELSLVVCVQDTGGLGGFDSNHKISISCADGGADGQVQALDLGGAWNYVIDQSQMGWASQLDSLGRPRLGAAGSPLPGWLNHAMLSPLAPYAVRGAIWYQGESNVGSDQSLIYDRLFAQMIRDWRHQFESPELAFYYVQIAPYIYGDNAGLEAALLREAQRRVLGQLVHVGMVTVTDIAGNGLDIHPPNKLDVGRRLARWALSDLHGKEVVRHGPHVLRAELVSGQVQLSFDLDGGAFDTSVAELPGFGVAGADGVYHAATAAFGPGPEQLTLSASVQGQITVVRYAFSNNPQGLGLKNTEGLPASPFQLELGP